MKHLPIIPIKTSINKSENRNTFNRNSGHYLEFLLTETMKLLGNSANKINKDKNDENIPI